MFLRMAGGVGDALTPTRHPSPPHRPPTAPLCCNTVGSFGEGGTTLQGEHLVLPCGICLFLSGLYGLRCVGVEVLDPVTDAHSQDVGHVVVLQGTSGFLHVRDLEHARVSDRLLEVSPYDVLVDHQPVLAHDWLQGTDDPHFLLALRLDTFDPARADGVDVGFKELAEHAVTKVIIRDDDIHLLRSEEHTSELQSLMRNSYA